MQKNPKIYLATNLFFHLLYLSFISVITQCDTNSEKTIQKTRIQLTGQAFGTNYNITIAEPLNKSDSRKQIQLLIKKKIQKLDDSMSTWNPLSKISLLNQSKPGKFILVSKDFRTVFTKSKELYAKTNTFFDPASSAVFELWGFDNKQDFQKNHLREKYAIPTKLVINQILNKSGMSHLHLNHKGIMRKNEIVKLNFSAIAKGYLVDIIFNLLLSKHYTKILVEVGGELRVGDAPLNSSQLGADWKIGIEKPLYTNKRKLLFIASLKNIAMATSGDYRNYYKTSNHSKSKHYSHIINPVTGYPKKSNVLSATVIGPNCMQADALATTLLVLNAKKGLKMMRKFPKYEALLMVKENVISRQTIENKENNLQFLMTKNISKLLKRL